MSIGQRIKSINIMISIFKITQRLFNLRHRINLMSATPDEVVGDFVFLF